MLCKYRELLRGFYVGRLRCFVVLRCLYSKDQLDKQLGRPGCTRKTYVDTPCLVHIACTFATFDSIRMTTGNGTVAVSNRIAHRVQVSDWQFRSYAGLRYTARHLAKIFPRCRREDRIFSKFKVLPLGDELHNELIRSRNGGPAFPSPCADELPLF